MVPVAGALRRSTCFWGSGSLEFRPWLWNLSHDAGTDACPDVVDEPVGGRNREGLVNVGADPTPATAGLVARSNRTRTSSPVTVASRMSTDLISRNCGPRFRLRRR